jgi:N-ethylmaleimide reductase
MATYYAQRASAGLLITEATAISQQGQGYADVPGLYAPEQLAGWRKVCDTVHGAGGRIVVQLWHVGRVSHCELQPGGQAPVAPSALRAKTKTVLMRGGVPEFVDTSEPRALRFDELPGIVQDYRRAARAAVDAGFDGVEVHGANGYLLDQFLRSGSNLRDDAYGGSIAHRARLMLEVMQAICTEIGSGRVGLRLSPVTPANDASDPEPQALFEHVVRALGQNPATRHLAYLHLIEGQTGGARDYVQGSQPFDYAALRRVWKAAGGTGAWMVNNGYTLALANKSLADGADLVAFGRPFIANPDLVRRLRENAPLNVADRSSFYGGHEKGYTDYPALAA